MAVKDGVETVRALTDAQQILALTALDIPRHRARRMKHVRSLDGRFSVDDLTSEGYRGLLDAARTWIPDGKISFRKWAAYKVDYAILDHVRSTLGSNGKGRRRRVCQPLSLEQTQGGTDDLGRPLTLKALLVDQGPAPDAPVITADILAAVKRIAGRYYPAAEAIAFEDTQASVAARMGVCEAAVSLGIRSLLARLATTRVLQEIAPIDSYRPRSGAM